VTEVRTPKSDPTPIPTYQPRPAKPNATIVASGDDETSLTSSVALRRDGQRAWLRVTGQLTALARRHLDDWLDWLIQAGVAQVTVSLATAEQIDDACLRVLRVAQSRLRSHDGELIVTAGRAQVRAALTSIATRPCRVTRLPYSGTAGEVESPAQNLG
jgi:anti-anti-sigma regulatory factor